eukprot:CAMPEP_0171884948 /NCGR_PEP_ID=MMETSP0992-20121227/41065_1 /TAXON_ID=483369 /ORGANISM="non described non described, Strain CCMP2098" /LENGTH=47 /DNA_ID= /DNA_START= /DNA_END= /DNA_ORIENTATION=
MTPLCLLAKMPTPMPVPQTRSPRTATSHSLAFPFSSWILVATAAAAS